MAIVETEEVALWPFHVAFVLLRLTDVQNNSNTVLVIISNEPLVRIRSIRSNDASRLV